MVQRAAALDRSAVRLSPAGRLALERDGALRLPGLIDAGALQDLRTFAAQDDGVPGRRLHLLPPAIRRNEAIRVVASEAIGKRARAVRAILFDKTPGNNWPLGWHQDRTIAVAERHDVPRFANWNEKDGIPHVEPPFDLLARMVTMRIHIDPVAGDNAPLLVALGTHRLGRIAVPATAATVAAAKVMPCLADAGDVWVYATPILHASEPAACPRRRRVLQIDWSADVLPCGLRWTGLDDDG
jgi:hypothetical protein